jgi:hypothetical protein
MTAMNNKKVMIICYDLFSVAKIINELIKIK